ncbi:MAG: mechanosensitive ion channel family protein [Pseudolabrys sp.]
MTPAAAPMAANPPPEDVRGGFALVQQTLDGWRDQFLLMVPNLVAALLAALIFLMLAWGIGAVLRHAVRRAGRYDLAHMLASFAFWVTLFLGALVVMTILLPSMRPVDIFASLGIGSVAVGFAFKDILQNWIAGFFILIRRPFHRGDQIKVGDIEGTVQAVETRATLVKTYSGRLVIIPNSDIYTRSVTVHTAYANRRAEIIVPVGMDVDLDQAMEVFRKAVLGIEHVLEDPPPDVLPWEFSQNNVNIRVRWWMKSQRTFEVRTRAAAVIAIKRACEEVGINIPADTTISFAETPLIVASKPAGKSAAANKPQKPKPKRRQADDERAEEALAKPADERSDPEAEQPKLGELNEGVDTLPR